MVNKEIKTYICSPSPTAALFPLRSPPRLKPLAAEPTDDASSGRALALLESSKIDNPRSMCEFNRADVALPTLPTSDENEEVGRAGCVKPTSC